MIITKTGKNGAGGGAVQAGPFPPYGCHIQHAEHHTQKCVFVFITLG